MKTRAENGTYSALALKQSAVAAGLKHYETDEPCSRGHIAKRFVSNGGCAECLRLHSRAYQKKNREVLLPKKRQWAKDNPERNCELSRKWYAENTEKALAGNKASKQRNWANVIYHSKVAAAKRRASLLKRTPKWADCKAIKEIYKACPVGFEVDHIVPLLGKTVCGLHVENNLQYLTKSQNASKGNRHE